MDIYADWAPSYAPHAHNALMEAEQAAVLAALPPVAGRRVLDAGCGTGRYMRLLSAFGARVVGVDASAAMSIRARTIASTVMRGDIRALPVASGSCDIVVSGLAIIDVPDLSEVMAEFARVLCRRGVLVCSTLHPAGCELGWNRTFEVRGETRSLPAHWHSVAAHQRACGRAGLDVELLAEPALERGAQPVALICRARKTGHVRT